MPAKPKPNAVLPLIVYKTVRVLPTLRDTVYLHGTRCVFAWSKDVRAKVPYPTPYIEVLQRPRYYHHWCKFPKVTR